MSSDEQDGAASRAETAHAAGTSGPADAAPADVPTPDASATDATDTPATDATDVSEHADATDAADVSEHADTAEAGHAAASEADREGDERADVTAARQDTGRSGPPHWLVLGSTAAAAAAFVVAAVFGTLWWFASTSDEAEIATTRDRVTDAVRDSVVAFTELDHAKPDEFIARQKRVVTDTMREEIEQTEQRYREVLSQAGTKVTSTVQEVAIEELNVHEGKAGALATVRNDVSSGERQVSKTMRLTVTMQRVDEDGEQVWKLANIGQVPVVGAGAGG
ncbi:hypothetical protein [Saccharomonospora saliphila]|uniref:hypothetical protein n=1 Tax=Saccharomonospora saliphila TaxID=369829 RepID=UPI00037824F2|nr:hypothetical protein [Saccharomonospora saliphila]